MDAWCTGCRGVGRESLDQFAANAATARLFRKIDVELRRIGRCDVREELRMRLIGEQRIQSGILQAAADIADGTARLVQRHEAKCWDVLKIATEPAFAKGCARGFVRKNLRVAGGEEDSVYGRDRASI